MKKNKILIIAAHPDDEVLGCGGLISKYKDTNEINIIFVSDGESSRKSNKKLIQKKISMRKKSSLNLCKKFNLNKPIFLNFPDNQIDSVPLLKIVQKLEKYLRIFKPNMVFTHYENCLNIDHRITFNAVVTACRPIKNSFVKKIVSFEIPSSTDWNLGKGRAFQPNYFIDISSHINEKIKMIKFYKSELKKYPHSRSIKSITSLASFRGVSCGTRYAEGFYLHRYVE